MAIVQGKMPIVLSAAQQICVEEVCVVGVIWIPSAVSHSFVLSDNGNNVLVQGSVGSAANLVPIPLFFPEPIPCNGLVLKAISAGDTILIYPAGV